MLVIFDCDGVLVDSERAANQLLVDNLAEHGLSLGLEEGMALFVGGTMAGVKAKARAMGARLPPDWIDQIYARTYEVLRDVAPIPGVLAAIERIEGAGHSTCIASNGPMAKMEVTLGSVGLWGRYQGRIFSAHVVGIAKPDPGLFLHAAAASGFAARDCVVVEDSGSGVRAAVAAGMRCMAYAPEGGAALADLGAEVFRDMADLPDRIGPA